MRVSGGSDSGKLMVKDDFASAYPKYPFNRSKEYLTVESVAKKAKKGLWKVDGLATSLLTEN